MAKSKVQPMKHKLMCHHYKFVVPSKIQAFLLKQNLCFTKNPHIPQNSKLEINNKAYWKNRDRVDHSKPMQLHKKVQTKTIIRLLTRPR